MRSTRSRRGRTAVAIGAAAVSLGVAALAPVVIARAARFDRLPPGETGVALTFDDGPDARGTASVLATLRSEGVPATFFLVGTNLEADGGRTDYSGEGLGVAGHSYSHPRMRSLGTRAQLDEIGRGDRALEAAGLGGGALYRPPHGSIGALAAARLAIEGRRQAGWSIEYDDYAHISDRQERIRCFCDDVRPGDIILIHDGNAMARTVAADLPLLVAGLRARGFEFVALPGSGG